MKKNYQFYVLLLIFKITKKYPYVQQEKSRSAMHCIAGAAPCNAPFRKPLGQDFVTADRDDSSNGSAIRKMPDPISDKFLLTLKFSFCRFLNNYTNG